MLTNRSIHVSLKKHSSVDFSNELYGKQPTNRPGNEKSNGGSLVKLPNTVNIFTFFRPV